MINNYNLTMLMKLRKLEKDNAERDLQIAQENLEQEQKKLTCLQEQLSQKKLDRTQMHDNFFHKALKNPSNKQELNCLALHAQKSLFDETSLKSLLCDQLNQVKNAECRKNKARNNALMAQQDFKAISKHYSLWQQNEKKREDLHIQNDADDQNGARFWLKKRA
jgi:hypothetical protein